MSHTAIVLTVAVVADVRVLVVDDHRAFSEALAALLGQEPDLWVVGTASRAEDALRLTVRLQPDVVTVDIDLGADDGVELSRQLSALVPRPAVVVVSCVDDVGRAVAAFRAGCLCWVAKDARSEELVTTVRGAVRGESRVGPTLLAGVLAALTASREQEDAAAELLGRLTARELQVLERMVAGHDRAWIAADLFVTTNTVRTHVQNVLAKLGAHSSLEAVAIARHSGMSAGSHGTSPTVWSAYPRMEMTPGDSD